MPDTFSHDEPLVISFPAFVKASVNSSGRRMISVTASNEACDGEGDVILQKSLLDSAGEFLRSGCIDVDHVSEVGHRYGIKNTSEWIVGVPTEVKDIGKGSTSVTGELHKAELGKFGKADEIWESLLHDPPVRWSASIYGFPNGSSGFVDVRVTGPCQEAPHATRYVVKSIIWKSLALTRSPVNASLGGYASIVTAKSWIKSRQGLGVLGALTDGVEVSKDASLDSMPTDSVLPPRNRMELMSHFSHHIEKGKCPFAGNSAPLGKSVASFRSHFSNCCGVPSGTDDILALALMQALKHERHL